MQSNKGKESLRVGTTPQKNVSEVLAGNNNAPIRYMDFQTIYCESGVANKEQVSECLKVAIEQADRVLGVKTNCKYKVNLILSKEGKYFGFGYIRVSDPRIYWMLLGKNPDGTERVQEYLDPNWVPPPNPNEGLTLEQMMERNKNMSWHDRAKEEDLFIQPKIKVTLPPLVTIPGFLYDEEQIAHLRELAEENGDENLKGQAFGGSQNANLCNEIPTVGFFEISRAYATDPEPGKMKNRLCARNVPDWIPEEAFKAIFSFYTTVKETVHEVRRKVVKQKEVEVKNGKGDGSQNANAQAKKRGKKGKSKVEVEEEVVEKIVTTYPIVNFVESKKDQRNGGTGRIVFITFSTQSNDAIFALLMTKKTHIVNPKNPEQKTTLIFLHAYDNQKN